LISAAAAADNYEYDDDNNNNNISIQFNSLLFMCRVNSYKANYRHSTVYNNNNNNNKSSTEGKIILTQKVNKQRKMRCGNKNMITKNYITQNIRNMNNFSLMSVNVIERNGRMQNRKGRVTFDC
jgi:hypothetical protein